MGKSFNERIKDNIRSANNTGGVVLVKTIEQAHFAREYADLIGATKCYILTYEDLFVSEIGHLKGRNVYIDSEIHFVNHVVNSLGLAVVSEKNFVGQMPSRSLIRRKQIIVINGKGTSGKDTLVKYFSEISEQKGDLCVNVSAIDPIKNIAKRYGYSDTDKNDKARKFLSDLKKCFIDWNDMSNMYLVKELTNFINSREIFMFVHIREPEEIKKFIDSAKQVINECYSVKGEDKPIISTILIKRDSVDDKVFGNSSDDDVENFDYDFTYHNNLPIEESCDHFVEFMNEDFVSKSYIEE